MPPDQHGGGIRQAHLRRETGTASLRKLSAVAWVTLEQIPEYGPRLPYAPALAYVAEGAAPGV